MKTSFSVLRLDARQLCIFEFACAGFCCSSSSSLHRARRLLQAKSRCRLARRPPHVRRAHRRHRQTPRPPRSTGGHPGSRATAACTSLPATCCEIGSSPNISTGTAPVPANLERPESSPGARDRRVHFRTAAAAPRRPCRPIVGNSWGGHTALEVLQHERSAGSAGGAPGGVPRPVVDGTRPARPAALPVNANRAVSYCTRNAFVWGKWTLGSGSRTSIWVTRMPFMKNGKPAYDAQFDARRHRHHRPRADSRRHPAPRARVAAGAVGQVFQLTAMRVRLKWRLPAPDPTPRRTSRLLACNPFVSGDGPAL